MPLQLSFRPHLICLISCAIVLSLAVSTVVHAAETTPRRLVTLGGRITETVFALGAGAEVVGADRSSDFPPAVLELPRLNYHRMSVAEGILALNPTHVIKTPEAGPAEVFEQIAAAGAEVITISADETVSGTRELIRQLAGKLGHQSEGEQVLAALDSDLTSASAQAAQIQNPPRVLFIYARGAGMMMIAGANTPADAMIALAGGANAAGEAFKGMRAMTAESVIGAQPDVLLLMNKGLASLGGREALLKLPGIGETSAGRRGAVIAMEDSLLLNFGPRLGRAVGELARRLHEVETARKPAEASK